MSKDNPFDWSGTDASNSDIGGTDISGATGKVKDGDNAIRAIMAQVSNGMVNRGSDVATASTLDLDAATTPSLIHDLTGTTSVTAVTLASGNWRICRAVAAFTLTAGASLIVNGSTSVNYTTAANDLLFFEGYGSGVVRVWVLRRILSTTDNTVPRFDGTAGNIQTSGVAIDDSNNLLPPSNDGGALGLSGTGWSDVALASGAVIDWAGGDVTLTHASNALAFAGASSGYTFDATVSVPNLSTNSAYTAFTARNTNAGSSAQTLLTLGNNSDANDAQIILNSSGFAGTGSRLLTIKANGGALALQAAAILYAAPVYVNTTPTGANVAIDTGGELRRSTSSRKYKRDITPFTLGLDFFRKLKAVFYKSSNRKEDGSWEDDRRYAGLIAEQVDESGGHEFVSYGPDGSPEGLFYDRMAAVGVTELVAEIDRLSARVAALEAKA